MFEGTLFLGSESMASFDGCERLLIDRNSGGEEANCALGESELRKEIVVGVLEGGSEGVLIGSLPVGGNGGDRTNAEGFSNALQGGEKEPVGCNFMHGPGSNSDLSIASLDALQARNQESFRSLGFDHLPGDDGERENIDDITVHSQAEGQLAFVIVGSGQAQSQRKAIAPIRDCM